MEDLLVDDYDHVDQSILYTPSNIPGKGCDESKFRSRLFTRCICTTECNDSDTCACLKSQGLNYENGRLVETKLLHEHFVLECNDECRCSLNCGNRVVQFGPTAGLKFVETSDKGYGIITEHRILKGQFVCEYAGEIISSEEAIARRSFDEHHNYIFSLNEFVTGSVIKTIVDATRIGNIGRYINHSCEPNCKVVPVRIDTAIPKLAIFASQDIDANEEVTYSYGSIDNVQSENKDNSIKPCFCGTVTCKKFLPYDL